MGDGRGPPACHEQAAQHRADLAPVVPLIDIGGGRHRLGGSALAQVYGQIGDESPDVDDPALLKRAFRAIQGLIEKGLILSGHDRSDGGLEQLQICEIFG